LTLFVRSYKDIGYMAPPKNAAAVALARQRWAGTTAEERSEAARQAVNARWARWRAAHSRRPRPSGRAKR
jgi:hypothetical protein